MPPFLGCQCWSSFDDKTPFPGARAILTRCVLADLVFEILKKCIPDWFDVLCSDKT